jgi:deoxyhypusine synthase
MAKIFYFIGDSMEYFGINGKALNTKQIKKVYRIEVIKHNFNIINNKLRRITSKEEKQELQDKLWELKEELNMLYFQGDK